MHQELPSQCSRGQVDGGDDDFENCLPGFRLTHILNVVSGPGLEAVAHVLGCLKYDQACVSGWTIARRGEVLDQRISLQGISERRVRSLREQLLRLEQGLRIRLEHQFSRHRITDDELPTQAPLPTVTPGSQPPPFCPPVRKTGV